MTAFKPLWLALALLGSLAPASALAQDLQSVTMPITGWGFIGKVGGRVWLGISQDGGYSCAHWKRLSETGKLTRNLGVIGSAGSDFIYLVNRTTTMCGNTFEPLDTDGFLVLVTGREGNDVIDGGNAAVFLSGEGGNDSLQGHLPGVQMFGHDGNDRFYSRTTVAAFDAGNGDDVACALHSTGLVSVMDGGNQNTAVPGDRRCGAGTSLTRGWETNGCLGYCW